MEKRSGFDFWKETLNEAKYIVAPMVEQSELPWRMLSRKYGAELCYTPMFHAAAFVKDKHYRKESLQTCEEDHPLIVQFCANDPEILLKAAQLAEPFCVAIDINLGCPQGIAKKGHYGAFLQDEWDLIAKMVSICHKELKIPITCKIRRFPCIKKTVEYAQMLEKAGCQLLTVHGRTREQKGPLTGLADWSYIKHVRESVNIPVFANGNIQYLSDVNRCLKETGVNGVMTAEGNLHNPSLFKGVNPCIWDISMDYLDFVEKYPCASSAVRGHIFKICHHALQIHVNIRDSLASGGEMAEIRQYVEQLKQACQEDVEKHSKGEWKNDDLPLPYWICQPYVRPDPTIEANPEKKLERDRLTQKRAMEMNIEVTDNLSKKKLKRLLKHPNKISDNSTRQVYEYCSKIGINCCNPRKLKCAFEYCRPCCRKKTKNDVLDCAGHGYLVKTAKDNKYSLNSDVEKCTVSDNSCDKDEDKTQSKINNGANNGDAQEDTQDSKDNKCGLDNKTETASDNKDKELVS